MGSTAAACDRAATGEAVGRSASRKTTSFISATGVATSGKAVGITASVVAASPATVVPRARADKDATRKPFGTVVAVGRTSIRVVRVITVSADWRASHDWTDADTYPDPSDNDCSLRECKRHSQ